MYSSRDSRQRRTFRSGAYLERLFRANERMDERLQADICARIKRARIEAGFTQQEAADLLGMTLRGYQNYEKARVPFRSMTRIAEVFRVPESWLLHGSGVSPPAADAETLVEIAHRLGEIEDAVRESTRLTLDVLRALRAPRAGGSATPRSPRRGKTGTDG